MNEHQIALQHIEEHIKTLPENQQLMIKSCIYNIVSLEHTYGTLVLQLSIAHIGARLAAEGE